MSCLPPTIAARSLRRTWLGLLSACRSAGHSFRSESLCRTFAAKGLSSNSFRSRFRIRHHSHRKNYSGFCRRLKSEALTRSNRISLRSLPADHSAPSPDAGVILSAGDSIHGRRRSDESLFFAIIALHLAARNLTPAMNVSRFLDRSHGHTVDRLALLAKQLHAAATVTHKASAAAFAIWARWSFVRLLPNLEAIHSRLDRTIRTAWR